MSSMHVSGPWPGPAGASPYSGGMVDDRILDRIDAFADPSAPEQVGAAAEDLARAERARLQLTDRLRGGLGARLRLHLENGSVLTGVLRAVGADWCELELDGARGSRGIAPLARIGMLEGLGARHREADGALGANRSLGSRLRELQDEGRMLSAQTSAGTVRGRLTAVGADSLDLAITDDATSAGSGAPRTMTVPVSAVILLRTI